MTQRRLDLRRRLLRVSPWLRETDFLGELRELWGGGLATPVGILAPLSHVVRTRLKNGNVDGLADAFAFLAGLLVSDVTWASVGGSLRDDAATCFFENTAEPDEKIKRLYTPILRPEARAHFEALWPNCLTGDIPAR